MITKTCPRYLVDPSQTSLIDPLTLWTMGNAISIECWFTPSKIFSLPYSRRSQYFVNSIFHLSVAFLTVMKYRSQSNPSVRRSQSKSAVGCEMILGSNWCLRASIHWIESLSFVTCAETGIPSRRQTFHAPQYGLQTEAGSRTGLGVNVFCLHLV